MADKKISELTAGSPAQATDAIPVSRAGANYQLVISDIVPFTQRASVLISSATFKAGFSAPVTLVAGSTGYLLFPYYMTLRKLVGTAYVLNGNTNLVWRWSSPHTITTMGMAGIVDTSSETFFDIRFSTALSFQTILNSSDVGAGFQFALDTADMVTGGGNFEIGLVYDKVPKSLYST